ncbi:mannose-1-phosphate guanylyltransferase [Candidatus Bipolaricaulota bacterium]|nr:mannose-1-phosphate guanylyltransferase [Candidatus Bipolaricaulota bacterium]
MSDYTVYAVIMAGGQGTRLWPLSTRRRPKQFIDLGGESLLTRTFKRIEPLVPRENVLVVTGQGQGKLARECLPSLPEGNVIEEPMGKNTAPCIGLSAVYAERYLGLNPEDSVMIVSPADHLITKDERFRDILSFGAEMAYERGEYVTLGIEPTRPATGYGYIRGGDYIPGFKPGRRAEGFTEKPDRETAKSFVESGDYFWNSGTFVWRTDRLIDGLTEHLPDLHAGLNRIADSVGTQAEREVLTGEYEEFSPVSIDYGLMEKAGDKAVIPASIGWSDLGDWPSLGLVLDQVEDDNNRLGKVEFHDSANNLVYSGNEKPVVLLGVDDLVVANTRGALLVMKKDRAQGVKAIAKEHSKENGGNNDT